jgi:hypothetical protein
MENAITAADILKILEQDNGLLFITEDNEKIRPINEKLQRAFPAASRNHIIKCSDYNTVYVTSDIHSDLRKFVQMLLLNNLLGFSSGEPLDPYSRGIYNFEWLERVQWMGGENTILVIVGDLVDGRREYTLKEKVTNKNGTKEVLVPIANTPDDTMGIFELYLFILIHNLRLSANAQRSEMRFTIGNHELMSVITPTIYAFDSYVSDWTRLFFGDSNPPQTNGGGNAVKSMNRRAEILLPFFHTSPYYMLRFANGETQEIVCVHGGLHKADGNSLFGDLERLQQQINNNGDLRLIQTTDLPGDDGPLWTRIYSESSEGMCDDLTPSPLLTIVGHCITGTHFPRFETLLEDDMYEGCEDKNDVGCVLMDCNDVRGAPRLLFVDTGSGKSMRLPSFSGHVEVPNEKRLAQMIKLSHHEELATNRFYNQIERVVAKDTSGLKEKGTILFKALTKEAAAIEAAEAEARRVAAAAAAAVAAVKPDDAAAAASVSKGRALPAGWGLPLPAPAAAGAGRPSLPNAWALAPSVASPKSKSRALPTAWGPPSGGARRTKKNTHTRMAGKTRKAIKANAKTRKSSTKACYQIHDNGDTPFEVNVRGKTVEVCKGAKNADGGYDNYDEQVLKLTVKAVYPGTNLQTPMEVRVFGSDAAIGNTVLLHVIDDTYIYIGGEIYQFNLQKGETVEAYYSKIGSNDVPYPVLITSHCVYFLIEHVCVSRALFDRYDMNEMEWADAYQYYYGFKGKRGMKKAATKIKGMKVIRKRFT